MKDSKTAIFAIASDHGGYDLKEDILNYIFNKKDYLATDFGMHKDANHCRSVDYPDYARKIADVFHPRVPISLQFADFGVLICGTGIGMSIAANRHSHIRAALCHDVTTAKLARQHNDANVLVLGARLIAFPLAIEIFETFASTDFEGGRHSARILKLNVED